MRTITITEALNELKLYDSKISKAINNAKFIGATKKSLNKVGVELKEDFNEKAKSSYQSIGDLIKNRNVLKSQIVKSNANTEVDVAGVKMTRAEAIERKGSIDYEVKLLEEMKKQYSYAVTIVNNQNEEVNKKVDSLINTLVGREGTKSISKEDQENIEKPYRENNEYELVDPLKLLNEITILENSIDAFNSSVDTALVLSNATSFIEVN